MHNVGISTLALSKSEDQYRLFLTMFCLLSLATPERYSLSAVL